MDVTISGHILTLSEGQPIDAVRVAESLEPALDGVYAPASIPAEGGAQGYAINGDGSSHYFINSGGQWYFFFFDGADYQLYYVSDPDLEYPWDTLFWTPILGPDPPPTISQATDAIDKVYNLNRVVTCAPFSKTPSSPSMNAEMADVVIVSGAGTAAVNGTYVRTTDEPGGGGKRYILSTATPEPPASNAYCLWQDLTGVPYEWRIYINDGEEVYHTGDQNPDDPWDAVWQVGPDGTGPAPTVTQGTIADVATDWYVRLQSKGTKYHGNTSARFLDIKMGDIPSQPTWTNSQQGAQTAANDIMSAIGA